MRRLFSAKIAPNALVVLAVLVVTLPLSAYFVAAQPVTPRLAVVSSLAVIAFALPSYWAVVRLRGLRRGLLILAALGLYALAVESSALASGFPYGDFVYTDALGNKLFGLTPWTVAFAYPPLLLLAYTAARRLAKPLPDRPADLMRTAALTALLATACDIVLDPAAVRLGFWYWHEPGWFYGVPLVNFAGWLLSSYVGAILLHILWGRQPVPAAAAYSGLAIVWFWAGANAWLGQWLPALAGLLLSLFFYYLLRVLPDHRQS